MERPDPEPKMSHLGTQAYDQSEIELRSFQSRSLEQRHTENDIGQPTIDSRQSNHQHVEGDIELSPTESRHTEHEQLSLPPVDGGRQAWLLLAGCFIINVLIWGFAFSFGVLQEYYTTHEPFSAQPGGIATIGTVATGLQYLLMPLYFAVLQRWPYMKRRSIWAALLVVPGSLVAASFAQTTAQLIGTQGVLFALGGNLLVVPTITYLDEWFVRRKGLAVGIMWAGDGAGGIIMPLVLQQLLESYGFRITLRALAVAMFVFMTPLPFVCKARLPLSAASATRKIDVGFFKSPVFWVLQGFNIVQGMGYFLPSNYMPSYAQSLGVSSRLGSLTLVLVNVAAMFGCIICGALVDRFEITAVLAGVSLGAAISVFAIWGSSSSLAVLCVFAVFYGITAGAYSTTWAGMIMDIKLKSTTADANVIFGFLAAGRGIGATISGPLSEGLIASGHSLLDNAQSGYEGKFGPLIIFSGCTALVGGFSWIARRCRWI